MLIHENMALLTTEDKVNYDQLGSYIYIATLQSGENENTDVWLGKVGEIKKITVKKTEQIMSFAQESRKLLMEQEKRQASQINALRNQTDTQLKLINEKVDQFGSLL